MVQKALFFKPQPFSPKTIYLKFQKGNFFKLKNINFFKNYKGLKLNVEIT